MPAALVEIVAAHDTMDAAARKFANTIASAIAARSGAVPAADEAGDERRRRGDEQPALHHVDRDVAFYGRGRVHGLPSSSRAIRAR